MSRFDERFLRLFKEVTNLIESGKVREATVAIECYEADALRSVELFKEKGTNLRGQQLFEYYAAQWAKLRELV